MAVAHPFLRKAFRNDALLWILCLFAIEINVLELEEEVPCRDAPDGDAATVAAPPAVGPAFEEI